MTVRTDCGTWMPADGWPVAISVDLGAIPAKSVTVTENANWLADAWRRDRVERDPKVRPLDAHVRRRAAIRSRRRRARLRRGWA